MPGPRPADDRDMSRAPGRVRLVGSFAFALVTIGATVLLGRRFTHTSWPLQHAHLGLVACAVALYFMSFVFRALGWQKLFPAASRPDRAGASRPAVLPRRAARFCPSGWTTW